MQIKIGMLGENITIRGADSEVLLKGQRIFNLRDRWTCNLKQIGAVAFPLAHRFWVHLIAVLIGVLIGSSFSLWQVQGQTKPQLGTLTAQKKLHSSKRGKDARNSEAWKTYEATAQRYQTEFENVVSEREAGLTWSNTDGTDRELQYEWVARLTPIESTTQVQGYIKYEIPEVDYLVEAIFEIDLAHCLDKVDFKADRHLGWSVDPDGMFAGKLLFKANIHTGSEITLLCDQIPFRGVVKETLGGLTVTDSAEAYQFNIPFDPGSSYSPDYQPMIEGLESLIRQARAIKRR